MRAYKNPFVNLYFSHLLGKKSWNVYNADNIARVKQDEAAAKAREAAEEQRMQEVDAERRIQILRGLHPDDLPAIPPAAEETRTRREPGRDRKRRRIAGEDDTDRDLRLAREHNDAASRSTQALAKPVRSSDAPLTDHKGHINLFPAEGSRHHAPKNAEAEAEAAKKKKEFEDQYTMRFSNAAGFKQSIGQQPWYSSTGAVNDGEEGADAVSKDIWGNEDPRRKEREKLRIASDDPMAAIKKGVAQLRQVERERQRWKEERDRELRDIVEAETRREKKKRERPKVTDDLENFSLNDTNADKDVARSHHRGRHHRRSERSHHRRHRSRSHHRSKSSRSPHHREDKRYNQIPTPPDDDPKRLHLSPS